MSAPVDEQETLVSWMRGDKFAEVYTSDTTTMTRLDRLCQKSPDVWSLIRTECANGGEIVAKVYKCPRKMVSFRSSIVTSNRPGNPDAFKEWREKQKEQKGE